MSRAGDRSASTVEPKSSPTIPIPFASARQFRREPSTDDRPRRKAQRLKTPNEIALNILLARADHHLPLWPSKPLRCRPRSKRSQCGGQGQPIPKCSYFALLVCLIPTTIGGLLSAIGIAGMDRLFQHNVIAISGARSKPQATLMFCCWTRPGTIALGNRQATDFLPRPASPLVRIADSASRMASLADETPEGRSIVVLAKEKFGIRERTLARRSALTSSLYRANAHERC